MLYVIRCKKLVFGGSAVDMHNLIKLSYDELRGQYKKFLYSQEISKSTINTAYSDTFYLWRYGSQGLFWDTVTSTDFENVAKESLIKILNKNSQGNALLLVNGYLSHLRRFRLFLASNSASPATESDLAKVDLRLSKHTKKMDLIIPDPSADQVEYYLSKWTSLENYHLQEDALNKLFFELCPENKDIVDILIKASTLNDFYSTNIFSVYPVAKHILGLDIDVRLKAGDSSLVENIQSVMINGKKKTFYSFATKYCSHHNPLDFPIYDSYVDVVLRYFQKRDAFSEFVSGDLKSYEKFKRILNEFRKQYRLNDYSLKQIDQYLWQLGKGYFPKNYSEKKQ